MEVPDVPIKPPNILVYTGEDIAHCSYYENIISSLKFCLNPECYTLNLLSPSQVIKDPWIENTAALVVSTAANDVTINQEVADKFDCYAKTGLLLNFCSNVELTSVGISCTKAKKVGAIAVSYKEWEKVVVMREELTFSCSTHHEVLIRDKQGLPVVLKTFDGNVVVSEVHLELDPAIVSREEDNFSSLSASNLSRLSILKDILSVHLGLNCDVLDMPKPTPCFIFFNNQNVQCQFDQYSIKLTKKKPEMFFVDCLSSNQLPEASDLLLPVYVNAPDELFSKFFDKEKFFNILKTKRFGQYVFFVDVVSTTMDILENVDKFDSCVVIASIQTKGKGRGQNKFISPYGCAAFSANFSVSISSKLGQRLSVIQQIISLAAVLAVRRLPGYEDLDLRLKWPNDIYYGRKCKIGGVLVSCSILGNDAKVSLGCGVNVANSKPTLCVNDIIKYHNFVSGHNLPYLTREEFIAHFFNHFEELVDDFQTNGPDKFISMVAEYWLHSNQIVTLDSMKQTATVLGLDDYGYLLVETENGVKMTLQPDGNSFDLSRNLICMKVL